MIESYYLAKCASQLEMLYRLKGSHHRVLFQNAAGTINMVQSFDHPDIQLEDIAWFQILGRLMLNTFYHVDKRLIKMKHGDGPLDEMEFMSCYVELHRVDFKLATRKGFLND